MISWDDYFIKMAFLVASKSKDHSTQVGCVIIGPDNEIRSTGFNGFPRGVVETVPAEKHDILAVEKNLASQNYDVFCSCLDIVSVPRPDHTRVGNFDVPHNVADLNKYISDYLGTHVHFNQPAEPILHPDRWQRPAKYEYVEHAERNAVYNAARVGIPLDGCIAYLNWEPIPCVECAKAFIQAGIKEVVGPDIPFSSTSNTDWKFNKSVEMFNEAGVKTRSVAWTK